MPSKTFPNLSTSGHVFLDQEEPQTSLFFRYRMVLAEVWEVSSSCWETKVNICSLSCFKFAPYTKGDSIFCC